jgi:hypothetical protein
MKAKARVWVCRQEQLDEVDYKRVEVVYAVVGEIAFADLDWLFVALGELGMELENARDLIDDNLLELARNQEQTE